LPPTGALAYRAAQKSGNRFFEKSGAKPIAPRKKVDAGFFAKAARNQLIRPSGDSL
jgi:hypothetical protein